jgi:hypothetical protein
LGIQESWTMTKRRLQNIFQVLYFLTVSACLLAGQVPGTVVHYSPAASGIYIGSPGIVILPDGSYVAKCDEFGPKSTENVNSRTLVFGSKDNGLTWTKLAEVNDMFWATLFVHNGNLYLLGNHKQYGDIVISKSTDGGKIWTFPKDENSGRLKTDGQYHCAPVPMLVHNGRIWRAMEKMGKKNVWGTFQAGVMSAAVDSDLLKAENWQYTNFLPVPQDAPFHHWLEGNTVLTPDGCIVNILRSGCTGSVEKAVVLNVSSDGKTISIDPEHNIIDMPGASGKKFTIRFDPQSKLYWAVVNPMMPEHNHPDNPGEVRNAVAVISSPNLKDWNTNAVVLYHPDIKKHAFQYPDWVFDGSDMIVLSRTAYDDAAGGAHNFHDANFLTFHRIKDFRGLNP